VIDFLSQNALYVVLLVVLVVWVGVYSYLMRIDRKLAKLEQRMQKAGTGEGGGR